LKEVLPSDDDRLAEVLEHEGEGRGGVGQGVGAVKHHEPVEQLVRVLDVLGDLVVLNFDYLLIIVNIVITHVD
jgi:hypothetical protein